MPVLISFNCYDKIPENTKCLGKQHKEERIYSGSQFLTGFSPRSAGSTALNLSTAAHLMAAGKQRDRQEEAWDKVYLCRAHCQ